MSAINAEELAGHRRHPSNGESKNSRKLFRVVPGTRHRRSWWLGRCLLRAAPRLAFSRMPNPSAHVLANALSEGIRALPDCQPKCACQPEGRVLSWRRPESQMLLGSPSNAGLEDPAAVGYSSIIDNVGCCVEIARSGWYGQDLALKYAGESDPGNGCSDQPSTSRPWRALVLRCAWFQE